MALDKETIDAQLNVLRAHRRTLTYLLRQAAIFGIFTPSYIAQDIEETRSAIDQLKKALGAADVVADDLEDKVGDLPGTALIERRTHQLRLLNVFVIVVVVGTIVFAVSMIESGSNVENWV